MSKGLIQGIFAASLVCSAVARAAVPARQVRGHQPEAMEMSSGLSAQGTKGQATRPVPSKEALGNVPVSLVVKGRTLRFEVAGEPGRLLGKIDLPVVPVQVLKRRGYVYAACGTKGLYVVDATDPTSPKVSSVEAKGRDVVGIQISGDLLLVSVARYSIGLFRLVDPAHPRALDGGKLASFRRRRVGAREEGVLSPVPMSAGRKGTPKGKTQTTGRSRKRVTIKGSVVRVFHGKAYLDKGSDDGLKVGDRVALLTWKKVLETDPLTHKKVEIRSRRVDAVVKVEHVEKGWARAMLGRGDRAVVGDSFETTDERLTANKYFPRRLGRLWRIRFGVWPVIGVNTRAFSLMSFSSISYEFRVPLKLSVEWAPFLAVIGKPYSGIAGNVVFSAAYSSRFFELGIGGGYQGVYNGRSGFVIAQKVRLGAIDGLNIEFLNQLVWSDDNSDHERRFMIGSLSGAINVPLVSRVTLYLSGGGGSQRYGYGDAGVRIYVHGVGGPGTVVISSSLGMAYVVSRRKVEVEYASGGGTHTETKETGGYGVTASVGMDFRF